MISLQTPKHDPRLVMKGEPPVGNLYKSYPSKLDRVQTPAYQRAFATVNTREPTNEKDRRKTTSKSKSNSSGRRASSGKRTSSRKRVSVHHQVPEKNVQGKSKIIKKKGKRSISQKSNYNRSVSSSSSVKGRNVVKHKQKKMLIDPPKVLGATDLALNDARRLGKKAESGFLSERNQIKERHFTLGSQFN